MNQGDDTGVSVDGIAVPPQAVPVPGPVPLNRAQRRRNARGEPGPARTGTEWVPLKPRFLKKLEMALMSSAEVKSTLESVVEASGEDLAFLEDVNYVEIEIQSARVRMRNLTQEERAELARSLERERQRA